MRPWVARLALPLLVAAVAMAVHWRTLFMFFSADDLVHLQQACGLIPTPHQPWRILTQVGYFRLMFWLAGPLAVAFMSVNLALHGANTALLFDLFSRQGSSRTTAALAAVLFGACPLLSIVIGHAVVINDISALTFALLMLRWLSREDALSKALGAFAFVVALLCKESVLFLPLLAVIPAAGGESARVRLRAAWPLLAIVAAAGLAFFIARSHQAAPSGTAYALSLWPAPFHNLMTYTRWFFSLHQPLPDLVRSPDSNAWHVGLPLLAALMAAGAWGSERKRVRYGLAWWILGLLPVLPLRYSTYPHYLYVALPGIALATAGALGSLVSWLEGGPGEARATESRGAPVLRPWPAFAVVLALLYALRSDALVSRRLTLWLQGVDVPLDPQVRSMVVAGRAVYSLAATLPKSRTRLAILIPERYDRVYGARTGREYAVPESAMAGYDVQRVILSEGRALRVFFPQLDSVAYVTRWSRSLAGFSAAGRFGSGQIVYFGSDLPDHLRMARAVASAGGGSVAVEYLDSLRVLYPRAPEIRALADSLPTWPRPHRER